MMCHFEHAKMESFWICCQSDHPVYSYWKRSLWTETPTQWSLSVLCAISLSCPVPDRFPCSPVPFSNEVHPCRLPPQCLCGGWGSMDGCRAETEVTLCGGQKLSGTSRPQNGWLSCFPSCSLGWKNHSSSDSAAELLGTPAVGTMLPSPFLTPVIGARASAV